MVRAERLLKILNLLHASPNLRARDLARKCQVSERTIYRDLNALSTLHVPVYFEDGYKLHSRTFLPPLNLTGDEALALKLAASVAPLNAGVPFSHVLESALAKLGAALSPTVLQEAEQRDRQISLDLRLAAPDSGPQMVFRILEDGVSQRRMVCISYASPKEGRASLREVDPYHLTFRRHAWYLVGYCHRLKRILTFRLDRIKSVSLTDKGFQIPKEFSLEKYFEKSWEVFTGPAVEVKARFAPRLASLIKGSRHHPTERIEECPDGSLIYTATVAGTQEVSWWLLGFGAEVEVLEPPELREEMRRIAQGMANLYEKGNAMTSG
ncbi:MAG: WYL domain-containing protein [candidate division NC10 bacterium]|nr:WYL domain-containing protein [candidate division NC10 bacterium]